jgi:hypothetical protein
MSTHFEEATPIPTNNEEKYPFSEDEDFSDEDVQEELAHEDPINSLSNEERSAYLAREREEMEHTMIKVGPVYVIRGERKEDSSSQEEESSLEYEGDESSLEDEGDESSLEDETEQDRLLGSMSNSERTSYLARQQEQLQALFDRLGLP